MTQKVTPPSTQPYNPDHNGHTAGAPASAYQPGPSMAQVRAGEDLLKIGQQGPAVQALQRLLAAAIRHGSGQTAADITIDARFGPQTERALRAFQRSHHLLPDGLLGPKTLFALEAAAPAHENDSRDGSGSVDSMGERSGDRTRRQRLVSGAAAATSPAPPPPAGVTVPADSTANRPSHPGARRPASAQAAGTRGSSVPTAAAFAPEAGRVTEAFAAERQPREQQAEAILRANGQWPPEEGRFYVIQIDQDSPPASASRRERAAFLRSYTGQTVVFQAQAGRMVERTDGPLASASHPGQFTARAGTFTSVDGDNIPDIAHLRSGVYQYRGRPNARGRFNPVSDQAMRVARDINHNGVIDGDRENNPDFFATFLQIHAGNTRSPSSVGCQTLPPEDYRELQQALASTRRGTFTYVLVRRPHDTHGSHAF